MKFLLSELAWLVKELKGNPVGPVAIHHQRGTPFGKLVLPLLHLDEFARC